MPQFLKCQAITKAAQLSMPGATKVMRDNARGVEPKFFEGTSRSFHRERWPGVDCLVETVSEILPAVKITGEAYDKTHGTKRRDDRRPSQLESSNRDVELAEGRYDPQ